MSGKSTHPNNEKENSQRNGKETRVQGKISPREEEIWEKMQQMQEKTEKGKRAKFQGLWKTETEMNKNKKTIDEQLVNYPDNTDTI